MVKRRNVMSFSKSVVTYWPCYEKSVQIFKWKRAEFSSSMESTCSSEGPAAILSSDADLNNAVAFSSF